MRNKILTGIINKETIELNNGTDRILLLPVIKGNEYKYCYKIYKAFDDGDGIIRFKTIEKDGVIFHIRYIERQVASVEIQDGLLTGINDLINKWLKEGYSLWRN